MFYQFRFYALLFIGLITVACSAPPVAGFTITEPKAGTVFYAGDKVTVRAVAAPNENPVAVYLYSSRMHFHSINAIELIYRGRRFSERIIIERL